MGKRRKMEEERRNGGKKEREGEMTNEQGNETTIF